MRRIPIQVLTDPKCKQALLEGEVSEKLPANRVYVDPDTGKTIDGSRGHTLLDLRGNEIELPKTTWW